ncbi:MAG TPA: winged helix-turn-helix domain-containing protein [Actinopolymorphaceae bacterium]|nr:winged helix-turn-helix domain-containing protein [Actinopolymorphaceae bacterium]
MLTIALDASQLTTSRFVTSPLLHAVTSLLALSGRRTLAPGPHWLRRVRDRLDGQDLGPDVRLLTELVNAERWYVPDFLSPIPSTASPSLDDDLAAVAATDPARIRRDLGLLFDGFPLPYGVIDPRVVERQRRPAPAVVTAALRAGESELAASLAKGLRDYWSVVLATDWPLIRTVLDEDLQARGRQLARSGAASLFADLHPAIRWDGELLRVEGAWDLDLTANRAGLVLAPCVFAWPRPFCCIETPTRLMLGYPARGSAVFWTGDNGADGHVTPESVPGLLGGRRAGLLADLDVPRPLHHLAARHRLSPATVSYHLGLLRRAGLVEGRRAGKEMRYERTEVADAVLATLRLTPPPSAGQSANE